MIESSQTSATCGGLAVPSEFQTNGGENPRKPAGRDWPMATTGAKVP